jgi:hypothetical protein
MEYYSSDLLGVKVDPVMREAFESWIGERISEEVTPCENSCEKIIPKSGKPWKIDKNVKSTPPMVTIF